MIRLKTLLREMNEDDLKRILENIENPRSTNASTVSPSTTLVIVARYK